MVDPLFQPRSRYAVRYHSARPNQRSDWGPARTRCGLRLSALDAVPDDAEPRWDLAPCAMCLPAEAKAYRARWGAQAPLDTIPPRHLEGTPAPC